MLALKRSGIISLTSYNKILKKSFYKSYNDNLDLWTHDYWLNNYVINKIKNIEINVYSVLDIGAGKAQNCVPLLDMDFTYIGIDIYKHSNWKILKNKYPNKTFFINDYFLQSQHHKKYGLILDIGCFHHQEQNSWNDYLNNVKSLLEINGKYLLVVSFLKDDSLPYIEKELPSGKKRVSFSSEYLKKYLLEYFKKVESEVIYNKERKRYLLSLICTN